MAKEPDGELKYPQLTIEQIDLWLLSPVSQALIECLEWRALDSRDAAGSGQLTDSSNADLTHAQLHVSLGKQDAYREAKDVRALLEFYNLVIIPKPEEPDDDESANAA